jgi:hypothetical protein
VKLRTVIGLTGAAAASFVGMAGLAAGPAGAAPATTMPAANLTAFLGVPVPIFASPFTDPTAGPTFPDVKMTGNCEAAPWLFAGTSNGPPTLWLDFQSGNAVVYRPNSNPVFQFLPGGLNAVGEAKLVMLTGFTDSGPTFGDTGFAGPAHVWLGQNANGNGQMYLGETVTFSGTAPDGSTISFTANPGFVQSASGHQSGWGQQNLSCNIATG